MRCLLRSLAVPLGFVLVAGSWTNLAAQQPSTKPGPRPSQPAGPTSKAPPIGQTAGQPSIGAKPVRPAANDLVVEQLSPELELLLKEWEQKSALIKSLDGKHQRTVYNYVFEVEKRATGIFYLETPDKGRIDLFPDPPKKKDEVSVKIGKTGNRFRIEGDGGQKWICTGKEIVMVNDEEKTYQPAPLPPELYGENIVNGPLPFLFGMKAAELKQRFQLHLIKFDETSATLKAIPRFFEDQQNYTEAWIMLDRTRYLPIAVKLVDAPQGLETIYKFDIKHVNRRGVIDIFVGDRDPFRPDFKKWGYKQVLPPPAEIADPRQPGAGANRPGPANGSKPNGTSVQPVNAPQPPRTTTKPAGTLQK